MISRTQALKFYFEDLFATNWSTTKVHFIYEEFEGKGKWINLVVHPQGSSSSSLSRDTALLEADVNVVCWAETSVEAFELVDMVTEFMETNVNHQEVNMNSMIVIDQGVNASNKPFVYISFPITMTVGHCVTVAKKLPVVNNAVPVVNNGISVIN